MVKLLVQPATMLRAFAHGITAKRELSVLNGLEPDDSTSEEVVLKSLLTLAPSVLRPRKDLFVLQSCSSEVSGSRAVDPQRDPGHYHESTQRNSS